MISLAFAGVSSLALSYAGLSGLCLAMDRHHQQVLEAKSTALRSRLLRTAGWSLLLLSLAACVWGWSVSVGLVLWFGLLSVNSLLLITLLPYMPRTVPGCAVAATSIGGVTMAAGWFTA